MYGFVIYTNGDFIKHHFNNCYYMYRNTKYYKGIKRLYEKINE